MERTAPHGHHGHAPGLMHGHLWHGPGMVRRALHGARKAPFATTFALVILIVALGPMLWHRVYAVHSLRLVDLDVYRDAGRSVLMGRPLYDYLTPVPQLLPFTYPPFSSVIAVPLAMMPFGAASLVWTIGTLAVLGWLVVVSFRPLVRRFAVPQRPVVVAILVSAMAWTLPIRDEFRYGQVGIFLAALCVLDCVVPKTRWPRGMLIGLAIAIKLTPAVFVPYLWLTGRRRAAIVATLWFAGATTAMAIAMPQASRVFWTSALFDSKRVGDNAGTPNQSLRSIFLRSMPGASGTVAWLIAAVIVAVVGYHFARRASLAGDEIRGIAIAGLLAVLLSPVAWIHHLAGFLPLVVGAVLGDGRDRKRIRYAVALTLFFTLELPWWGATLIVHLHHHWRAIGRVVQDSFAFGSLAAIWLMGRLSRRPATSLSG